MPFQEKNVKLGDNQVLVLTRIGYESDAARVPRQIFWFTIRSLSDEEALVAGMTC